MRQQVIEIMARIFEMDIADFPTEINKDTIENWDSLRHLNLISELEETFEKNFEMEDFSNMTSLDNIILMLEK
jgi:acyl carrier protein, ACP